MHGLAHKTLRLLCVAWILPIVFSTVAYYGFVTNFTHHVFTNASFDRQYEHGVYKFRVLGPAIQKKIDRFLDHHDVGATAPKVMRLIEKNFSTNFYVAYYLNNTLFLCLACTVFFFIFDRMAGGKTPGLTDLLVLMLSLLLSLSQFVIAPYDMLSNFLTALGFFLVLSRRTRMRMLLLCVVMILGALTRETIVMVIAFYFTLHWREVLAWKRPHTAKWELLALLLCFLGVYAGLRLAMGSEHTIFQTHNLKTNFTSPLPILGVVFIFASTALLLLDRHGRPLIALFLLATLPYTLSIFYNSFLWEIRLWVPVLLGMIVLKTLAATGAKASASL